MNPVKKLMDERRRGKERKREGGKGQGTGEREWEVERKRMCAHMSSRASGRGMKQGDRPFQAALPGPHLLQPGFSFTPQHHLPTHSHSAMDSSVG